MKTLNIGSGKYKDNNGEWSTLPCLKGDKGNTGESAYQLAVRLGTFTGTEEEYNEQFSEIVRKTNAAEKSIKEAENKIQENIKNIGSLSKDLKTKINIPLENPEIGKILKVKSINEDGTFVCEWADSASDLDVQIDGKSIVQNGVAEIPLAKNGSKGIVKLGATWLTALELISDGSEMVLGVHKADPSNIDTRYPHNCGVVVPSNLDYAVKAAMCDGKGAAWTADEQSAARERMGIGEWELVADIVLEEKVQKISFTIESWKELFVQIDAKAVQDTVSTTILYPFTNANFCDFYPGPGKDASIYVHMVKFDDYALYYELSFNNKSGNSGTPKSSIVKCSVNHLYFTRDYFESGTTAKVWSR